MARKKVLQAIIFLAVGIFIFWYIFRDTNLNELKKEINKFSWSWIGISIFLNILSQMIRAIRWKLLFTPLGYSPGIHNLFFSILILAFTNQIIPRGGEIARLGTINRYEKIPFAKLFGTALVERLTDLIILLLIFVSLVLWQFPLFKKILALPEISPQNISLQNTLLILGIIIITAMLFWILSRRFHFFKRFRSKLEKIKNDTAEGFRSLSGVKNKTLFFVLSLLIYALWLLMLYVLFFAYPPVEHLSFKAAAFTFGLATLAFLLPIQSGIGAWHFVVIQCLLLFGIDTETGKAFSLVAHAATNLVYIPLGLITFVLLFLVNRSKKAPVLKLSDKEIN